MLASGFVDVIIEARLHPYNVQALRPIIEGAGGVITASGGSTAQNGGSVDACSNAILDAHLVETLRHAA